MAFNYDEYLRTDKPPALWCWGRRDGAIAKRIFNGV
jgi:2-oxoglutarate ferredoxin oxidoreductase subunit beta